MKNMNGGSVMTPTQIEQWALSVVERVEKQHTVEDVRVELKTDWPNDANKVARRLAGHANAARGEPVLWLIGVDEENGVTGASASNLSDWFAMVQSEFDGVAPRLTEASFGYKGKSVVAIYVETD